MWVSLLILGISGVPILEKKYDAKFVAGHPLAKASVFFFFACLVLRSSGCRIRKKGMWG
jgi:hypothetical protein